MARAASRGPFELGAQDLLLYGGIKVSAKAIERVGEHIGKEVEQWMRRRDAEILRLAHLGDFRTEPAVAGVSRMYVEYDGTGIPIRRAELAGRKGKQPDGSAHSREVKLGCVFTQTSFDKEGRPVRDRRSTTYVGAIETSAAFGLRIYAETIRRGWRPETKVIVLTDGAAYNKSISMEHFPFATHVIDFYHARENLHEAIKLLVPPPLHDTLDATWGDLLYEGDINALVIQMESRLPAAKDQRAPGLRAIHYFQENAACMQYALFREQGLFIGSGVIEGGCRAVIGQRLKASGMFWSEEGANDIVALRCCIESNRFQDFWDERFH
jgi:hypothetical protein